MTALKQTAALAALLAGVAGTASADVTYSGAVNLGYTNIDSDGAPDATNLSTDFAADIAFGNGFELDLGLGLNRVDMDGLPFDVNLDNARIAPKYNFGNGVTVGVYAEELRLPNLGADQDITSYGLTGEYDFGVAAVSAYYGESDIENVDDSAEDWGLAATYAMGEQLSLAGGFARSTVNGEDLDVWKIGAAYDFGNNVTVFGGAQFGDFAGADLDVYGLGASYDFSGYTPIPVIASIEYAQIDGDAFTTDADIWRFGVTLPFGQKGATAPLNSVAGSAFGQTANTQFGTMMAAY